MLAQTKERLQLKMVFHQFSFPDDSMLQNTIQKTYIQND